MPAYFNAALDLPAGKFYRIAQSRRWGWKLSDGLYLPILLFADNYWLIARSNADLEEMTALWLDMLNEHGWGTPHSELTWATTLKDEEFTGKVIIEGKEVSRADRNVGFKALGTYITFNGRNDHELKLRIARAWQAFHKYACILCNKKASTPNRLRMFVVLLHATLFWCSGSWNLNNAQLSSLKGLQLKMLRKMFGGKRPPDMSLETYLRNVHRKVSDIKYRFNVQDLDVAALRHHYGWAGHVSRIAAQYPDRLVGKVLFFRDREWLDVVGSQNYGRQLHCRSLRIWRWERPLYKYASFLGVGSWHELAKCKRSWLSSLDDMALWFRDHRA